MLISNIEQVLWLEFDIVRIRENPTKEFHLLNNFL